MKWRYTLGAMALIGTSSVQAAMVILTPPGDALVPGEDFTVVVDAFDFPSTAGATLGLVFDAGVVDIAEPSDFRLGTSPFIYLSAREQNPGNWTVTLFALPPYPNGDFEVFLVDFKAVLPGTTTIALVDEETPARGWAAPDGTVIAGVSYDPADVHVLPIPAAVWMMLGGLGLLAATCRKNA